MWCAGRRVSTWVKGTLGVIAGIIVILFVFLLFHFDEMGQSPSRDYPLTPLECVTKNFSDFLKRAAGFGARVDVFTLKKLCEREWLTFGVGWPRAGSLDLGTCVAVHNVIFGNPGHPDQMPYIEIWLGIAHDRSKYLQECKGSWKQKGKDRGASGMFVTEGKPRGRLPVKPTAPVSPRPLSLPQG